MTDAFVRPLAPVLAVALWLAGTSAAQADATCTTGLRASNPDVIYILDDVTGTATDIRTGLEWKRCVEGETWTGTTCDGVAAIMRWGDALAVAEAANTAGHDDWRLPNVKELRSLVEDCATAPAINTTVFPSHANTVWSSTPDAADGSSAFSVSFLRGRISVSLAPVALPFVRLVRAGRSFTQLQPQAITFTSTAPAAAVVGGGGYAVAATGGGSPNPVTFTIDAAASGVCAIAGNVVSFTAVGTCTINANQAGDANYAAAPQVQQSFGVSPGAQATLTAIATPASIAFNGSSALSTTGGSGTGAVSYAVTAGTTICAVAGSTLTGIGVGTCTVTATKAADANFSAITATVDVSVGLAPQATLTAIATPASIAFNGSSALSTTGGSGTGAVSYAVTAGTTSCAVAGSTLTGIGVGTCTVTATKAADTNFNAATATVDISVGLAPQATLTAIATPASITFNGSSALSTTGGSGTGAVSYVVTSGTTICSVTGSTLTGIGVGICTVTATKAADANFNAATATVDVSVGLAPQATLTAIATPASIAFNGTSALSTTGGSGTGAVSYVVTSGTTSCAVAGSTLTGIGVGTCTVTATKAADANFSAITATVDVSVGLAPQATLTAIATPASITFNGSSALSTTGGSGTGAVSYVVTSGTTICSVTGSTLTGIGVGTCTVTATKAADANFSAATATVVLTVEGTVPAAPGNVTVTFNGTTATIAWMPPAATGGLPLTGYTVTLQPGGATCTTTPPQTQCAIGGLLPGQTYVIAVTASNAVGVSAAAVGSGMVPGGGTLTPLAIPATNPWTLLLMALALLGLVGTHRRHGH